MKTMKFCPVFLSFYALNVAFMMLNYNTVLTKTQGVSLEGGKKRKKKKESKQPQRKKTKCPCMLSYIQCPFKHKFN